MINSSNDRSSNERRASTTSRSIGELVASIKNEFTSVIDQQVAPLF